MNSKLIKLLIFCSVVFALVFVVSGRKNQPLVKPVMQVSAPAAPEEIKYDNSTDLKKELDAINPQVSDSDFSE